MHRDVTPDTRAQMTSVFKNLILPLPASDAIDEQAWVDRLLLVCSHLDEGGIRAIERLSGLKGFRKGNAPYKAYVLFCEENNVSYDATVKRRAELTWSGRYYRRRREDSQGSTRLCYQCYSS